MTLTLPLGPVMADIGGLELTDADIQRLQHPLVGAVILFARNYQSPEQLMRLTASIRALRSPALIIAVDHEGGRVQRFKAGFTAIPPMRTLGLLWEKSPIDARDTAQHMGYLMGRELTTHGVDFSFTPVLDIDWGNSGVIGDRAFHSKPHVVIELAGSLIAGLHQAGVANCGKHFPGHGYVQADSHHAIPRDERPLEAIAADDLQPFQQLAKVLDSIMPAHVIYERIDSQPAGFSSRWLKQILRGQLGFSGIIFSDDLSMEGAAVAGDLVARAECAFSAGCDMVLLCNDAPGCDRLLAGLSAQGYAPAADFTQKIETMRAKKTDLAWHEDARYQQALTALAKLP
ncbi:MAG: beta-N-acetylhexosaminidase [Betaproteobacteria bacterium]|nr:beta-N-acetylhexosaminidase [Betaproteobacteria bacterium]